MNFLQKSYGRYAVLVQKTKMDSNRWRIGSFGTQKEQKNFLFWQLSSCLHYSVATLSYTYPKNSGWCKTTLNFSKRSLHFSLLLMAKWLYQVLWTLYITRFAFSPPLKVCVWWNRFIGVSLFVPVFKNTLTPSRFWAASHETLKSFQLFLQFQAVTICSDWYVLGTI